MLSDDAFEEAVRSGYSIDTRGFDGIDAFFADVFLESMKTPDARVRAVVEAPGLRRLQLPKARPVHQLVASTRPRITTVKVRVSVVWCVGQLLVFHVVSCVRRRLCPRPQQEGTEGHALGAQAWQQVARNHFMSEKDQAWVCNLIAARHERMALALEAEKDVEVDLIFQKDFRKGYLGIEDEKRRLLISQNEEAMRSGGYSLGDDSDVTEWDVEAVVDEDEL